VILDGVAVHVGNFGERALLFLHIAQSALFGGALALSEAVAVAFVIPYGEDVLVGGLCVAFPLRRNLVLRHREGNAKNQRAHYNNEAAHGHFVLSIHLISNGPAEADTFEGVLSDVMSGQGGIIVRRGWGAVNP
jgi:hypothetical protein